MLARPGLDAQEALVCVKEYDPDAVLMDLAMPGMSGLEGAAAIRERYRDKRPVLIAITGEHERFLDEISSQTNGFDYYLIKPPDQNVLMALLEKARRSA